MATANVNGVRLFYELSGNGEVPLVLVHGAWASHSYYDLIVPRLSETFKVLTYDLRGHSDSERPDEPASIHKEVADLAALIEHLDFGPAWAAGCSSGASIPLRLACERPELLRGVIAPEPNLFSLIAEDPAMAPAMEEIFKSVGAVLERIASGDHVGATGQFMEEIALGPDDWARVSQEQRRIWIENAPSFLNEAQDPETGAFDLTRMKAFSGPVLLTKGDQSPPMLASILAPMIAKLAEALPNAAVATFPDAGHVPHFTHPEAYAEAITAFVQKNRSASLVS